MAKRISTEEIYQKKKELSKIPPKVLEVLQNSNKKVYHKGALSFNQLATYWTCPTKWYLTYVDKLAPYEPSIHTVFGSAIHETIQHYLQVFFDDTVKAADEIDLDSYFKNQLKTLYKEGTKKTKKHFSTSEELLLFYIEGTHILNYFKKKRGGYFSKKYEILAGVESLLEMRLPNGTIFMGYIDLVIYDKRTGKWRLIDLKTSTRGWSAEQKKDLTKTSQLLLYKKFFAQKYDIDPNDISVEYLILKRHVPKEADFASMQRRIQEFKPSSGKIAISRVSKELENFIKDVSADKPGLKHKSNPSKSTCKFCIFNDKKELCPNGIKS